MLAIFHILEMLFFFSIKVIFRKKKRNNKRITGIPRMLDVYTPANASLHMKINKI